MPVRVKVTDDGFVIDGAVLDEMPHLFGSVRPMDESFCGPNVFQIVPTSAIVSGRFDVAKRCTCLGFGRC